MRQVDAGLVGALVAALSLSSCVGAMGPTVPVMPAPGQNFGAFNSDQGICQQYANAQIAPLRDQANNQAVGSALIGTALGAGLGAAIGGGRGAAIGAASGAVVGTSVAASNAQMAGLGLQDQYNVYYGQCMSSKGYQVPGFTPGEYGIGPYSGPGPGAMVPPPRY